MTTGSGSSVARILLVDDDPQGLESARKILDYAGYQVVTATDGQQALERVRAEQFDVVVSDVRMPNLGGLEFLRALSLIGTQTPVILMTAFGQVEDAVWAMKMGAVDFLSKPFKRPTLLAALESALKRSRAAHAANQGESSQASGGGNSGSGKSGTGKSSALSRLIGGSSAMRSLRGQLSQIAPTAATVLLHGESGTGKELIARAIHEQSPRAQGAFIAINCAAVPEQLIESELFGFEKGSFTGASVAKEGLLEAAHGGTLLLDEIGDMPILLQTKLLRVLQEGEVRRVGATESRKIDVRVIAASHRDLREAARVGTFRQDLLFRLEVISLKIPPLRERSGDLADLSSWYLAEACRRHSKSIASVSPEAMSVLVRHTWPGNVRELANVIERAVVFATHSEIRPEDLPSHLLALESGAPSASRLVPGTIEVKLGTPLREVEEMMIRRTLEATSGDKNMTAKLLGINSRTIYRKLEEGRREDGDAAGAGGLNGAGDTNGVAATEEPSAGV